MTVTENLD